MADVFGWAAAEVDDSGVVVDVLGSFSSDGASSSESESTGLPGFVDVSGLEGFSAGSGVKGDSVFDGDVGADGNSGFADAFALSGVSFSGSGRSAENGSGFSSVGRFGGWAATGGFLVTSLSLPASLERNVLGSSGEGCHREVRK